MRISLQIIVTAIVMILSILFFALSDVDILVQDYFYNHNTHKWILDWGLQPYKFIFYDGIKKLLILFAISLLLALVFFRNNAMIKAYKRGIIIVILSAIFVPSVVGLIKNNTNMPCPKDEVYYGGEYPRTAVWEHYPTTFEKPKIKCWPAGHASGGFALLSLFFLFKREKNRAIALVFALGIGWSMGMYKMLIGDHFLSHTVITMLMAWLIILIIVKLVSIRLKE